MAGLGESNGGDILIEGASEKTGTREIPKNTQG